MTEDNREAAPGFVGVGSLAAMLGVSATTVREWEALGIVPTAGRIEPRDQRVWSIADLEAIQERVAAKRATGRQHSDRVPVAG